MIKRQLENRIIQSTRSLSLRGKFVLFYCVIVFVPTVLLALFAGYFSTQSVRSSYVITIQETVKQIAQSIDFKKQSYDLLATRTATDGELEARLSRDYYSMEENFDTVKYVDRSFLLTSKYLPGIDGFRIYHNNNTLVSDGGLLWKPGNRHLAGMPEQDWFTSVIENPAVLKWSNLHYGKDQLVITRKINSVSGSPQGVVFILLDFNTVFAEHFQHPFKGAGELVLLDENERIIASSNPTENGTQLNDAALQKILDKSEHKEEIVDGKLFVTSELHGGWTIAAMVHLDQLESQTKKINVGVGASIAFFILISIFLILTLLKSFVWRIRKLGSRMTDISKGSFDGVMVHSKDRDELGELEIMFNSMAGELNQLIEDNIQANLKEKEQAFRALQAQINPHFIYNSLAVLRWRAMDIQDDTQLQTIDALSTFYRLALNNQVNVTQIRSEITHVKAYLVIQQIRYPNRVQVEWDVEEDALELYTIKLILQPIVENSYMHGQITRKKDARIRIVAKKMNEVIRFEVEDNGKGMSQEALERVCSGQYQGTNNGFGLNNIRDRLRLYFGQAGILSINSIEDKGTTVSIEIPICNTSPGIRKGEF